MLFDPLTLPCGAILKNRIIKAAMSDSLGDGTGHPALPQEQLYRRWAHGGVAASIIGEVQVSPDFAEKPGNLVLDPGADLSKYRMLSDAGAENNAQCWLQLGHAGAMAYPPTSCPKGPSALSLPGLACAEMTKNEISALPGQFATTAGLAREAGFHGVEIHAAHGFLLSQFLSPLFNRRTDGYGGDINRRMRVLLEVTSAVREAVGPDFPVAVKINSSDQLEGGFVEEDALSVVAALDKTSIDLIDISGGTYFPGARAASDSGGKGPYFVAFAARARTVTKLPLMATGGFKTRSQAEHAVDSGAVDVVGIARALALEPSLPDLWRRDECLEPVFPKFSDPPEGGITAWYTMRLSDIGEGSDSGQSRNLQAAIIDYEARDQIRTGNWLRHFGRERK